MFVASGKPNVGLITGSLSTLLTYGLKSQKTAAHGLKLRIHIISVFGHLIMRQSRRRNIVELISQMK